MPTILQINSCANWGSTGKIAEHANLIAASHGFKTYTAYGKSMTPSQSELIKISSDSVRNMAILSARLFDNSGLTCKKDTIRLVERIKSIKPDIIHLHNLHAYYLNYPILFEYLNTTSIPIVWTLHDCWAFTGHCAHFIEVNCKKWMTECHHCPLKAAYPTSWFFDRSRRNYLLKKKYFTQNKNIHFVTVSKWMEDITRKSFFQDYDIRTIYNGVNVRAFCPGPSKKGEKVRLLGVASMWGDHKGLKDYYLLRSKLDKEKFDIVLVGLTEKQINNLPYGIEGHVRTNSLEELIEYYRSSDIVLSLSYGESMGLTPVEGMACGKPAIVYDNTAQPELVTNETGEVVETGNIDAVVKAIQTISKKGYDCYFANCRERAAKLFDCNKQFQDYYDLYESLISC